MSDYTFNLLNCPLDTTNAESFGIVDSYVNWSGCGLPELCVTMQESRFLKPLANDSDLARLRKDLANAKYYIHDHDKSLYVLFSPAKVLGIYRQTFDNPTYAPAYRALERYGLWNIVHTEFSTNLDNGVQSPLYTVYQKAVCPYNGIKLNSMPYSELSIDKQKAVEAFAHYLAKWGDWRAGELLDMQDIELDSWIVMLQDEIRSLDRIIVEDGLVRRNRLELGEWARVARSLLFQFSRKHSTLLGWNDLADVTVLGVDSEFLADMNVDAPNWNNIHVTVTTEGLLTTVEFSLKAVQE